MKNFIRMMGLLFLVGSNFIPIALASEKPIQVVATQAFFGDLVKKIGGEKVEVKSVASPKFNVHFVQPKPSDIRNVTKADLYVNAGLDLEAWSAPLLEAAGKSKLFQGGEANLDLSKEIPLLQIRDQAPTRAEGDIHLFGNPHYHMNPVHMGIMVEAISKKLQAIDPANTEVYEKNKQEFLKKLDQKITEWKLLCDEFRGQEIVSYHEDIAYFSDFLGLKSEQFLEPKPGIPPTPKHMQFLEEYIRKNRIQAIVSASYYHPEAAEVLSKKTQARVVTICQNAGEVSGTEDVFLFFDYNFNQISRAFKPVKE